MANRRALVKRRKAVRNIRKITRTMELIATARFKKALDRAIAAAAFTQKITELVGRPRARGRRPQASAARAQRGERRSRPAGADRQRGLCGGYNGNVLRAAIAHLDAQRSQGLRAPRATWSGKRGIAYFRFLRRPVAQQTSQIEDKPALRRGGAARQRAHRPLPARRDRLGRRGLHEVPLRRPAAPVVEHAAAALGRRGRRRGTRQAGKPVEYEFLPAPAEASSRRSCRRSFKVQLFKCFLDAAVSEQIARMVAMKAATETAGRHDQGADAPIQPRPPDADHQRAPGHHRRRRTRCPDPRALAEEQSDNASHGNHQRQHRHNHPGHRLDVRRRVRRRAPAGDLQRREDRVRAQGARRDLQPDRARCSSTWAAAACACVALG